MKIIVGDGMVIMDAVDSSHYTDDREYLIITDRDGSKLKLK